MSGFKPGGGGPSDSSGKPRSNLDDYLEKKAAAGAPSPSHSPSHSPSPSPPPLPGEPGNATPTGREAATPSGPRKSSGHPTASIRGTVGRSDDDGTDERAINLRLEDVSVFYGEVVGLSKVDLALRPGITGIVGPNGSGKSTLMRALTGLIAPNEGRVRVLDRDPFTDADVRRQIGFVPATECFYGELSGKKNLEVSFISQGRSRAESRNLADHALELIGLTADGHRAYGTWSRGMRQRLKLGLTLAGSPRVVLLDEPFLGVDPPSRRHLRALIESIGGDRTVLVSSHVLHEIEALTNRVGVLAHGRLLGFGPVDEIMDSLRDDHPQRIRVDCPAARDLAMALTGMDHVVEVQIKEDAVEFVTVRPHEAYRDIARLSAQLPQPIRGLITLNDSLETVFQHVTAAGSKRL